jgi:hypothetical protein
MDDEGGILRFHEADITAGIIRFGNTSYQASNIASVSVFFQRKMNNLVQACLLLAFMVALAAAFLHQPHPELTVWLAGGAATLFVIAIVWQHFWPQNRYTLQLKMTSGEVQPFTSLDRKMVFDMKNAIESTFVRRS